MSGTDVYHQAGDTVGPFQVTGAVNIPEASVVWSADHGTMSPTNGPESSLTVTSVPGGDGRIVVSAALRLDPDFATNRTAVVTPCPRSVFSLDDCTANFAPLPGSNAVFTVTLPGCSHANDPGWLEAEVVRVTTEGTQHVAWVDMDASVAGVDRYGEATNLPQHATFSWDGIAQASLDLAEYPEEFTQGKIPFNLAAPEVFAGQPVPPPRVTLVVRLRDADKAAVLADASRTIHVPQIVQVRWEAAAEALFRTPMNHALDDQTHVVYSADYAGDLPALMQESLTRLRAYYPPSANILFVPAFSESAQTTKFLFFTADIRKLTNDVNKVEAYMFGASAPVAPVQQNALGMSECFLGSVLDRTFSLYKGFAEDDYTPPQPFPLPVTASQMLEAICRVAAHEVGHALGLVDPKHLNGVGDFHNPGAEDQSKMMNVNTDLRWMFKPHPPVEWLPLNKQYLEFVLPVPE